MTNPNPSALPVQTNTQTHATPLLRESLFLLQTTRPGLWLTITFFYLLPVAAVGAPFEMRFWIGVLFFVIPFSLVIYGLNDCVDRATDECNPRKGTYLFGGRGSTTQLARLRWAVALAQLPFLALFLTWMGPRVLVWYAALALIVWLYNSNVYNWRGRPGWDLLSQSGYLLVFVLSSWINQVPQLSPTAYLIGLLFAMHAHLFGEVMDYAPDKATKRRTTAVVLGRMKTKVFIAAFLALEGVLIWNQFQNIMISASLGLGALWFLLDAWVFWKDQAYSLKEMRLFIYSWNFVCALAIGWLVWN